jgi:hypothetical protein
VNTTTCTDTSSAVLIDIIPGITNNTINASQLLCYNATPFPLIGSTPTGGGGGTYVYQWLQSTTGAGSGYSIISGATTNGYSPGALTTTTWYRRLVTTSTSSCPDTSAYIQITINSPITNNTISSAQNLCAGMTPSTLVGSSPSGGGGSYNYQWLGSLSGANSGFNLIGGANNANYSPGALSVNLWYRRIVISLTCIDTSAAIQISVSPKITSNSISAPQDICSGSAPATLTGSSPSGGGGGYNYQWQSSLSSSTSGFSNVTGANAIDFSPPALSSTLWYRRVVTTVSCSDTSAPIRILVNAPIINNIISGTQAICLSASATALTGTSATGGGGGILYAWQESTTSATLGFNWLPGTNATGYAPGALSVSKWFRRVVYTSTCSDTSTAVKVTVNALPDTNITGVYAVCAGSTRTYSVPSQTGVTFNWFVTGGTISSGSGTNSINVLWGTAGSGGVTISITNSTTTCSLGSSRNTVINPLPTPAITGVGTLCSGTSQTYTASSTGNGYNWSVTGGSITAGQNTKTITVLWGNGPTGQVKLIETAGLCSDSSTKSIVVNLTPSVPVITRNGGILSISALTGASYQWYKDGNPVNGSTKDTINASIHNGTYTVTVTLNGCSATSAGFVYVSTGINSNPFLNSLNIYPNPNNGLFSISMNLTKETNLKIRITDATGRIIF